MAKYMNGLVLSNITCVLVSHLYFVLLTWNEVTDKLT